MDVRYRFYGASAASSDAASMALSFAPDTLRQPTFFVGQVAQHMPFREAISALHHVVVSDLRFKPRDRTAYFEWLAANETRLLAEMLGERAEIRARLDILRGELDRIQRDKTEMLTPFYNARRKYFDWLYQKNRDAWFVLDPVITVHPDEISFECFSLDESTYGRLSCDHDVFASIGDVAYGTTNIDYSHSLYDEFQKIRSYRTTTLSIDPSGFEVQTSGDNLYREDKIDLPNSWVRGFLQVSSAMTLPGHVVDLHPMDMHAILTRLAMKKERHGPRSLRFLLKPGEPIEVLVEPWNDRLTFRRSPYKGKEAAEIRLWGRKRLMILARALPLAKSVRLHLLGTGLPAFTVLDFGGLRFTLGMSGWTANDWSRAGQFDLLAPRRQVDSTTAQTVKDALAKRYFATSQDIAAETGIDNTLVQAALTAYTQAGRVMFDLDKQVFRNRELSREPLPMEALRFASEQEEKADRFVANNLVELAPVGTKDARRIVQASVMDAGKRHQTMIALDGDDRMVGASCTCFFYAQNKLMRGPCEHMLATRRLFQSQNVPALSGAA